MALSGKELKDFLDNMEVKIKAEEKIWKAQLEADLKRIREENKQKENK